MPLMYTYVCAECSTAGVPSSASTAPEGWVTVTVAGSPQDYLHCWHCVIQYAKKKKAAEDAAATEPVADNAGA